MVAVVALPADRHVSLQTAFISVCEDTDRGYWLKG